MKNEEMIGEVRALSGGVNDQARWLAPPELKPLFVKCGAGRANW
jgi:hypothetical protein